MLRIHRLVTLTGSGGTGKTRLALKVASEMLGDFPEGVWLVELDPIVDPALCPRALAVALGLRDEAQRSVTEMLCDHLHGRQTLIVLDNCEHLIDACTSMADKLLRAAPRLKILASSREALRITGEAAYRVPSLRVPEPDHIPSRDSLNASEAVELFVERAVSAGPTFAMSNDDAAAIAQIGRRLDGIPLPIELAATKMRVLHVEQIAERLDDRLRLLTGGSRTELERYQILRAALDWSYNLLGLSEQVLFRRLSVFSKSWALEAAEFVCADSTI